MTSVVVTICTARRPRELKRLLLALRAAEAPALKAVVVVENDPMLEGKAVCEALSDSYPCQLICVVERARGFSAARNRSVAEALTLRPDFLASIDDDEWPESAWLRELLRIQSQEDADIVGGPVVPVPAAAIPHWGLLARYYGLVRDLPDGGACSLYGAGNFLARRACFERLPGPFDAAFDEVGGEDLHFFRRLDALGMRTRWAAKAIVFEETPSERLTAEWLLQRQRRRGFVNVFVQQRLEPNFLAESYRFGRSVATLIHAGVRRLASRGTGQPQELLAEMRWNYASGRLHAHGQLLRKLRTRGNGTPS
jgi:succinoglycan biosynthesis protein ExoM